MSLVVALAMLLIGLGVAYWTLQIHGGERLALFRHGWVAGLGWIARRTYVPLLGYSWDRVHSNLTGFEIRHEIWNPRWGSTHTLWFRTASSPRKIRVDVHVAEDALLRRIVEQVKERGFWSPFVREFLRKKELHELTNEPDVAAMGRYLANKTGTSLSEVVEEIGKPSRD